MSEQTVFIFDTAPIVNVIAALEHDGKIVCSYPSGELSFILKSERDEIKAVLFLYVEDQIWHMLATAQKGEILRMLQEKRELSPSLAMSETLALKTTGTLQPERRARAASYFIGHDWIGASTS